MVRIPSRAFACAVSIATLFAVSGCGAARLREANARAMTAADARVVEGCYDCLLEARSTYAQVAAGKDRKAAASAVVRMFETDVLIALREKELALDSRRTIDQARTLASRLPAAVNVARVLTIVDAVLPDPHGVPEKALEVMRAKHRAFVRSLQGELDWLATAPLTPAVRDYVSLAIDCSYWGRLPRGAPGTISGPRKPPAVPVGAPPLIAYRTAICAGQDTSVLTKVRAAVPHFAEAAYYAAKVTAFASGETGDDEAPTLLEAAYARFPRAPGVTFIAGWFNTAIGDCEPAVRYFDETIAIEPEHEQAYLERTICLTRLQRDSAAIESATRLIALDTRSTAQAYYWRSLNRLRRKELVVARSDIEAAKARAESDNILTLAGIIEHDQDDLTIAERDLRAARGSLRGDENCTAAWYLASVLRKRLEWKESATNYEAAMGCYNFKVAEIVASIAKIQSHPRMTAALKAKRIERLAADSVDQRSRYHAAAFNAANTNARVGNVARAEELLAVAARDPALADPVAKLRQELKAIHPEPIRAARPSAIP